MSEPPPPPKRANDPFYLFFSRRPDRADVRGRGGRREWQPAWQAVYAKDESASVVTRVMGRDKQQAQDPGLPSNSGVLE